MAHFTGGANMERWKQVLEVIRIRQLYHTGLTLKELGKMFDVHFTTIGYIMTGKTWKGVV